MAASRKTRQPHLLALAGIHSVEIKITVRPDQELRAERAMEINEDTAEVRVIYFYDTPSLDLFDAGIVMRARLVKGDDDDSTVKVRPVEAAKIADEWKQHNAFKLEADCVGERVVCSASLTALQKRDEIDEVAKGRRPIEKLFSKDQERFLATFTRKPIDFGKLHVLGPIRVLRWKLKQPRFPYDLTVEEWRLPEGDDLVEISIKTSPDKASQAQKEFDQHLRELGLDPEGAQETKTRTALKYFAEALGQSGT
jgi:adenylate cyclase class IV